MSNFENEYVKLVYNVLLYGEKRSTRNADTKAVFGESLKFDLLDGFPILEGRKIFYKGIFGELAAMLRRPTCVVDFEKWGCNYWKLWADKNGKLDIDYGNAWFDFEGFDQIADLKDKLKNNPTDRRMIISSWRPHKLNELSLPCCHYSYQFYVDNNNGLHMIWTQRSADLMIGVPSDAVFAAALLIAIAGEFDLTPRTIKMDFGDTHIYSSHIDKANEYIFRFRNLDCIGGVLYQYQDFGKDFCEFTPDSIELIDYNPGPVIGFDLHA